MWHERRLYELVCGANQCTCTRSAGDQTIAPRSLWTARAGAASGSKHDPGRACRQDRLLPNVRLSHRGRQCQSDVRRALDARGSAASGAGLPLRITDNRSPPGPLARSSRPLTVRGSFLMLARRQPCWVPRRRSRDCFRDAGCARDVRRPGSRCEIYFASRSRTPTAQLFLTAINEAPSISPCG